MKLIWNDKDGGYESRVWMWGFEWKQVFSVLLLKFAEGTRDAYHEHAFNATSWLLNGALREVHISGKIEQHAPGLRPVKTKRKTCHKVYGIGPATWALSIRGPWARTWGEFIPATGRYVTLAHGRRVI